MIRTTVKPLFMPSEGNEPKYENSIGTCDALFLRGILSVIKIRMRIYKERCK